ncbi:MAG: aminotransferase class IV [Pirellulaceae bacterium]|nr:aminotransferase class IV [Pirellulaceae bacterium]
MDKPEASSPPYGYRNQQLVPSSQLAVPVCDLGLINGTTIAEQVRTFDGKPFMLRQHYDRWLRGLELLDVPPPCTFYELEQRTATLVRLNGELLPEGSEQGICFMCSPGVHSAFTWEADIATPEPPAIFLAHTYPLNTRRWQPWYQTGVALQSTPIRDVPQNCWPKQVKIRSRLHYALAQRYAQRLQPQSFPILLADDDSVSDSATASFICYTASKGLVVRPAAMRFDSLSVNFACQLAHQIGIPVTESALSLNEFVRMDEVMLASTPFCLLPVASVDGRQLGGDNPTSNQRFPVFRRLLSAWSKQVEFDIAESSAHC